MTTSVNCIPLCFAETYHVCDMWHQNSVRRGAKRARDGHYFYDKFTGLQVNSRNRVKQINITNYQGPFLRIFFPRTIKDKNVEF